MASGLPEWMMRIYSAVMMILGLVLFGIVYLLCISLLCQGCAAPGARQGTVEAVTTTDLDTAVAGIIEEVQQTSQNTQEAVVAYNKTDQSTSDKWVNRGLMVGLVSVAVLVILLKSYPMGKRRWLRAADLAERGDSRPCGDPGVPR